MTASFPSLEELRTLLHQNTEKILKKSYEVKAGHIGGSVSMSQFLLPIIHYLEVSNSIDYRLVLGKGHASLGLYSILNLLNINSEPFDNYCTKQIPSFHGHTCYKAFTKLLASTGSLGHGLPIALGYSYAEKIKHSNLPTLCILGDGEMQEGTIWESLLHIFNMDVNLKVLIDYNYSIESATLDIAQSLKSSISITELSASSYSDLTKSIELISTPGPAIIMFKTTKLANVKSFESQPQWHAGIPNDAELSSMLKAISISLEE